MDFTLSPSVGLNLSLNRKQCLAHMSGQEVPLGGLLTTLWSKGSWESGAVLMPSITKKTRTEGAGLSSVCVFDSVEFPVYT